MSTLRLPKGIINIIFDRRRVKSFSSYTRCIWTFPESHSTSMAFSLQSLPIVQSGTRAASSKWSPWRYGKWRAGATWMADGSITYVTALAWWTNVKGTLSCNLQRPLPSVLPPLRDDNGVTEKLAVSALLLQRWQLPVSAAMMDSAPMPHSFLLDRYVNPLWSAASSSWETKLIYESISWASGQMGPFQSASRFVSFQIATTVLLKCRGGKDTKKER